MENTVPPSLLGESSNVRTPLNMGAMPSLQIIDRPGSTADTLSLKVRLGAVGTTTLSVPPSAISPSIRVTVEFQRAKPLESVSSDQTRAGLALMLARMAQAMRNVLSTLVALAVWVLFDISRLDDD